MSGRWGGLGVPEHQRRTWALCALVVAIVIAGATLSVASESVASQRKSRHTSRVTNIVVIFMENHTFDNVFGKLCVTEPRAVPCDGATTATVTGSATYSLTRSPDVVPIVDHSPTAQRRAMNHGLMNQWDQIRGCTHDNDARRHFAAYGCLTQFDPSQIPNLASLARHYAISDRFFSECTAASSVAHVDIVTGGAAAGFLGATHQPVCSASFGGSNPTRSLSHLSANGCTSNLRAFWVNPVSLAHSQERFCIPLPNGRIPDPTYPAVSPVPWEDNLLSQLSRNKISWRQYSGGSKTLDTCNDFANCVYSRDQVRNVVPTNQILRDARSGSLPNFSLVVPDTDMDSQLNKTSMMRGDNWIGKVVAAIMDGPDWRHTAIIITYDDCGCFYDHVAPPTGSTWGPRLPLVVVSPWANPGFTDHTPASFASIVRLVEAINRLPSLNARVARAYDLAGLFRYGGAPTPKTLLSQHRIPIDSQADSLTHRVKKDDLLDEAEAAAIAGGRTQ